MDNEYVGIERNYSRRVIWYVIFYLFMLHLILSIYGFYHPDVFLKGDRAYSRLKLIQEFLSLENSWSTYSTFLQSHGILGDYFPQLVLYMINGQTAVVFFQVFLFLLSIVAMYRLVVLLTHSWKIATLSIFLYAHLPHTLVFPHQLVSEALFVPLVVISFYYLGAAFLGRAFIFNTLMSALMLGLATLIRPITMLWPIIVVLAAVLFSVGNFRRNVIIQYLGVSTLPLIIWMSFMYVETGQFSMGNSNHDIPHNLYNRVKLIIPTLPDSKQEDIRHRYLSVGSEGERVLSVIDYLKFSLEVPTATVKHLSKDLAVFLGKSGINRIGFSYIDAFEKTRKEMKDPDTGWRRMWQKKGTIFTILWLMKNYPVILAISLLGSTLFVALIGLSAIGAIKAIVMERRKSRERLVFFGLMVFFGIYVFSVSQVVDEMQSRHRAPVEFIICVFAAICIFHYRQLAIADEENSNSN